MRVSRRWEDSVVADDALFASHFSGFDVIAETGEELREIEIVSLKLTNVPCPTLRDLHINRRGEHTGVSTVIRQIRLDVEHCRLLERKLNPAALGKELADEEIAARKSVTAAVEINRIEFEASLRHAIEQEIAGASRGCCRI